MFAYYEPNVSQTYSEVDRVYGEKRNFSGKDDFDKFINKQTGKLKKGRKIGDRGGVTPDSLSSQADFISSVYYLSEDTSPDISIQGVHPSLEVREYNAWLYKKDSQTGKGDIYTIVFSERGLPEELHTKKEIRLKIQRFLDSCEFGRYN